MEISKEQTLLIKAVAILMIVLYHFQYDMFGGSFLIDRGQGVMGWINDVLFYMQQEPASIPGFVMFFGFIGVNIFFVLSGYGLAKKFKDKGAVKVREAGKQIMKILIPFWLAHPIIHIVDWLLKNALYYLGFMNYETHFMGMHSFYQYIESMLIFPRWFSEEGALTFVGTWWFVGIIIQFYLLFPFLFRLYKKYQPFRVLCACIIVSFVYRYIVSLVTNSSPIGINEGNILMFINFPARLGEFALGMYLAFRGTAFDRLKKAVLSFPIIILGFVCLSYTHTMFLSDFLFALGGIFFAFSLVAPLSGYTQKFFTFIGKKSYSIYLYHEPTMKYVLKFIFPNWIDI